MKQFARQKCGCGAIALVTPTNDPRRFDVSCTICGRNGSINWTAEGEPPEFVPLKPNTRGRKAGTQTPLPDVIGKRFGELEVLDYAGARLGKRWWHCKCLSTSRTGSECGNTRVVQTRTLNDPRGGRRCRACNQHVLQQRAASASKWMYDYSGKTKSATAKGKA